MGILMTPTKKSSKPRAAKKPKKKDNENFIAEATKNEGGLHRSLGIPEDEKIPQSKIKAAEKRGGKVAKQATLADTLAKLRRRK